MVTTEAPTLTDTMTKPTQRLQSRLVHCRQHRADLHGHGDDQRHGQIHPADDHSLGRVLADRQHRWAHIGDDVRVGGLKRRHCESGRSGAEIGWLATASSSHSPIPGHDRSAQERASGCRKHRDRGTSDLNIDSLGDGAILAANEPLTGSPGSITTLLAKRRRRSCRPCRRR